MGYKSLIVDEEWSRQRMNKVDQLFLEAFRASMENKKVNWKETLSQKEWQELFQKAMIHQILPLIFEAVYDCPSAQMMEKSFFAPYKREMMRQVALQMYKTEEFMQLYQQLGENGVHPLVVKGIVCRQLYPNPDYRSSSDEDMLIAPEEFAKAHQALLDYGMVAGEANENLDKVYEVPYGKPGSPIYIELHKSLFPKESEAYGELNRFFEQVQEEAETVDVHGVSVRTMHPTTHLFYLICHAFKHFLHSGFGIRQVSDMVMFANAYGPKIDWNQILRQCQEIRADKFAAAVFQIGEKYLNLSIETSCITEEWKQIEVEEAPLLEDLLDSGIYGDSNMSRKHSSNLTLDAVEAKKQGKKVKANVWKSLFPDFQSMKGKYSYLGTYPWLLPVAYGMRIVKYAKESRNLQENKAMDSIKIGNQRIELLKKYEII